MFINTILWAQLLVIGGSLSFNKAASRKSDRSSKVSNLQLTMADEELLRAPSVPPTQYLSGWRLAMVIMSLYLGTFVMALDTNIIGVAVPKISSEFQALEDVAWYGSAYLLTVTAFQPAFGNLYKFFSIEGTYRACIVVFESQSLYYLPWSRT